MKTTKKRYFSALLSMTLLLPCLLAPTATAEQDFYPDATYDISTHLSETSGKWKYRELCNNPTCDDETKIPTSSGFSDISVAKDEERTYFTRNCTAYKRLGVSVDELHTNTNYRFQAWEKGDTVNRDYGVIYATYEVADSEGNQLSVSGGEVSVGNFTGTDDAWTKIKRDNFQFTQYKNKAGQRPNIPEGGYIMQDKPMTIWIGYASNVTVDGVAKSRPLGLDDISLREIPKDSDCIAYTKSATTADTPIATTDEVCFTFSNDIDYTSVTKDNVKLDGTSYDSTQVRVVVNETTRENKVSIKFGVLSPDKEYTVELSGITDAWGREIVGTNKTTIKTLPAVERTSLSFEGENGEMSSLSAGELTASLKLKSNVGAVKANIIAAECDGNKIVKIVSVPATLTATETDFTLPKMNVDSADHSVRVFVWSDGDYPVQYTRYGTFSSTGWKDAEY